MGFLVNSKIHPFMQKKPDMLASQVVIDVASHGFLGHDSYVDCVDLYSFDDATLVNDRGHVGVQTKADIEKVVANSKLIVERYRKLILA